MKSFDSEEEKKRKKIFIFSSLMHQAPDLTSTLTAHFEINNFSLSALPQIHLPGI